MADFIERFKTGFRLTEAEEVEKEATERICRESAEAILNGYSAANRQFPEFHPDWFERVRRGLQYVLDPSQIRKG